MGRRSLLTGQALEATKPHSTASPYQRSSRRFEGIGADAYQHQGGTVEEHIKDYVIGRACEYSVMQADVAAEHLAMAETALDMFVTYESREGSELAFMCEAKSESKRVGSIRLRVRI